MSTPSVTPGDLRTLASYNSELIRRPVFGTVFMAPYSAPLPTTLVAPNGQVALPDTFESVGRTSEDGLSFGNEREMVEVRGWGSTSVLRRDVQSVDATLQFAMLETKRLAYELTSGLDLSEVEMSADGEWGFTMPSQPPVKYWRTIAIGADGQGEDRIYLAKIFGRMTLSETDDESWNNGDDALMRNVTLGADEDDVAGGPYSELIFGPGALKYAEAMGITVGA